MSDDGDTQDSRRERLRAWLSQARFAAEEFYSARYRGAIARARRDEDDLFMLLVFSEMMGVPNPAAYYTLELQPLLLERFHEWHRRMGMERSPLDHFRCC
ncbi:DNA helicase [Billgrantia antri]|uniref:DNA helicase n=1 Tax=Halomonas sulfidivorans TaxID=2733488 RepID=A0ABX7WGA0_9GAMM|nr:cory-CC-star protein [Halomonas sulfidivorans]QTP59438.1 DNA helicase [Halomonas sulfidivorans]